MRVRWHSLALFAVTMLMQGCYLGHGTGGEPPGDPPVDPPISSACGCAPDEVCIRACWGEESCVPRPEGSPRADGCYADDPCLEVGFCFGQDREGVFECACAGTPMPTPVPVEPTEPGVVCGGDICGADEVCVEHCNAFAPVCQPAPDAVCDDRCGCYAEDPCGALGEPNSVCSNVSPDAHVVCTCNVPERSCEEALETPGPGSCDPATFGECSRSIAGVECCYLTAYCADGAIEESVICDDSCGQSCEFVENASDCAAYGCEWFDSGGACVEEEERVRAATGCIPPRGLPCDGSSDALCPEGQICMGFAFDPCAGSDCDACGAIDYRCSPPLLP